MDQNGVRERLEAWHGKADECCNVRCLDAGDRRINIMQDKCRIAPVAELATGKICIQLWWWSQFFRGIVTSH